VGEGGGPLDSLPHARRKRKYIDPEICPSPEESNVKNTSEEKRKTRVGGRREGKEGMHVSLPFRAGKKNQCLSRTGGKGGEETDFQSLP